MPRPFSSNLQDLLAFTIGRDVNVEEHSFAEITTTGIGAPSETHYLATSSLVIDSVPYLPHLRDAGTVKASINAAQNWNECLIENVSAVFGPAWLNNPNQIQGAKIRLGRYWRDLDTGQEYRALIFTGVVHRAQIDQEFVRLENLSDVYAASIGGGRRVARKCQWRYKDPATCADVGPETECNKLFNSPGGCSGRENQHRYGGFVFIQPAPP